MNRVEMCEVTETDALQTQTRTPRPGIALALMLPHKHDPQNKVQECFYLTSVLKQCKLCNSRVFSISSFLNQLKSEAIFPPFKALRNDQEIPL